MSLEQTRAIDRPQKTYEWEIEIVGPSTGGLEGLVAYAQSVTIPEESVDEIVINHKSERDVHAGRVASARSSTINFFDEEGLPVYRFFNDWMELIKNSETGGGVDRSLYGANVIVRHLNSDSTTANTTHTLVLGFPTNVGDLSLDYETSDVLKFDVTMSYQRKVTS